MPLGCLSYWKNSSVRESSRQQCSSFIGRLKIGVYSKPVARRNVKIVPGVMDKLSGWSEGGAGRNLTRWGLILTFERDHYTGLQQTGPVRGTNQGSEYSIAFVLANLGAQCQECLFIFTSLFYPCSFEVGGFLLSITPNITCALMAGAWTLGAN